MKSTPAILPELSQAGCNHFDPQDPLKCLDDLMDAFESDEDPFATTEMTNFTWNTTDIDPFENVPTKPQANDYLADWCPKEISAQKRYQERELKWTKEQLHWYWLTIFAQCVIIRVLSISLLIFLDNNGLKAIKSAIKNVFSCRRCRGKNDKTFDVNMEMIETAVASEITNEERSLT